LFVIFTHAGIQYLTDTIAWIPRIRDGSTEQKVYEALIAKCCDVRANHRPTMNNVVEMLLQLQTSSQGKPQINQKRKETT
jgi:hypothetical protein